MQKILARAGLGARRRCEEMIAAGRVSVNGAVVTEPGTKADIDRDEVLLDGRALPSQAPAYYMLNKPSGCLTTVQDDTRGRDTVMIYVRHVTEKVFPVGRLDYDTEGLLIFTNDGEFANRVMHPGHGVLKTYEAVVEHRPTHAQLERLRKGLLLDDGPTAPAQVTILGSRTASQPVPKKPRGPVAKLVMGTVLEIRIGEGRKRIVRRMLHAVGHPVLALRRTAVGSLGIGDLPTGQARPLSPEDIELIFKQE